jgi:anaerobic selenocysteine-containing dehydrogenase
LLLTVQSGKVVRVQGDPDHPAGQGYLCDDAVSFFLSNDPDTWTPVPLYRPGGAPDWEAMDWGRISRLIAERIKKTRDASFDAGSRRTPGIGIICENALLNNEESYLCFKLCQSLGVTAYVSKGEGFGALSFGDWYPALDRFKDRWYGRVTGMAGAYLPDPGCSDLFKMLRARTIKGMFIWGGGFFQAQPAGKPEGFVEDLEWLVLGNWFKNKQDFETKREKAVAACPRADIFCLPLAGFWEKSGSVISVERWVQWCVKVVDPRGQARSPLWIIDRLLKDIRAAYREGGVFPGPVVDLEWDYYSQSVPDVKRVAAEISQCFNSQKVYCGQGRPEPDDLTACYSLLTGYPGG